MTATALQTYTPEQITASFTKGFTRSSDRDRQTVLGPSEIGGCVYCVGYTMAAKLCEMPKRDGWGYAAWIGTMAHYWLEHNLILEDPITGGPVETLREHKVEVFEVPRYGLIKGHTDLAVPSWGRSFDFKFPGKWSYEKVQSAIAKHRFYLKKGDLEEAAKWGPSKQYRYQQQLYLHGLIAQGHEMEACRIIFLPRHSNNLQDVIHWEEPYNPQMVQDALTRTSMIFDYVEDGQLGELESDPDCYRCDTYGRGDLTTYNELFN